ncbi:hypothetical protein Ddc_24778 [Ditylenchus destructor]|nr:hypothetical protein Ddc_24778 [Ditylenchus destructor]
MFDSTTVKTGDRIETLASAGKKNSGLVNMGNRCSVSSTRAQGSEAIQEIPLPGFLRRGSRKREDQWIEDWSLLGASLAPLLPRAVVGPYPSGVSDFVVIECGRAFANVRDEGRHQARVLCVLYATVQVGYEAIDDERWTLGNDVGKQNDARAGQLQARDCSCAIRASTMRYQLSNLFLSSCPTCRPDYFLLVLRDSAVQNARLRTTGGVADMIMDVVLQLQQRASRIVPSSTILFAVRRQRNGMVEKYIGEMRRCAVRYANSAETDARSSAVKRPCPDTLPIHDLNQDRAQSETMSITNICVRSLKLNLIGRRHP